MDWSQLLYTSIWYTCTSTNGSILVTRPVSLNLANSIKCVGNSHSYLSYACSLLCAPGMINTCTCTMWPIPYPGYVHVVYNDWPTVLIQGHMKKLTHLSVFSNHFSLRAEHCTCVEQLVSITLWYTTCRWSDWVCMCVCVCVCVHACVRTCVHVRACVCGVPYGITTSKWDKCTIQNYQ